MNLILKIKQIFSRESNKAKDKEITNIINSMSKAKQLYKKLIVQAHPDKHPDKKDMAQQIVSQINENRYDYNALAELEKIIQKEL